MHGVPLVYLDTANTSQKPQVVLDAVMEHYARHNANVARAVHTLGSEATNAFEDARDKVAAFLNAPDRNEIVFTKNSSEALNLVAYAISNASTFPGAERFRVGPGDEIVVTEMEHHSNLVPWQLLCQRTGATFKWLPLDDDGRLWTPPSTRSSPSAPRSSRSCTSPTRSARRTRSLASWAGPGPSAR